MRRFNALPVRIIIGKDGTIKHVVFPPKPKNIRLKKRISIKNAASGAIFALYSAKHS
jgi:hypothetical protein